MRRISTIYQNPAPSLGAFNFECSPPVGHKAIGLLMSPNLEVSLSFNCGSDLKLHRFRSDFSNRTAPSKRVVPFDEPITGNIKGVISTLLGYSTKKKYPQVSIYLISEPNEN